MQTWLVAYRSVPFNLYWQMDFEQSRVSTAPQSHQELQIRMSWQSRSRYRGRARSEVQNISHILCFPTLRMAKIVVFAMTDDEEPGL